MTKKDETKFIIVPPKDLDELRKNLFDKIETINERKERANIDITRIQLEKALKMCQELMREERQRRAFI